MGQGKRGNLVAIGIKMEDVITIKKTKIQGVVNVPASKSVAHRVLILSALSNAETLLVGEFCGEDVQTTINALVKLGAKIEKEENSLKVTPIKNLIVNKEYCISKNISYVGITENAHESETVLEMNSSGSSLRFLLPLVSALGIETTFELSDSLAKRPTDELIRVLNQRGACIKKVGNIIEVKGKIEAGLFELDASVSSQYVTGLLMALPILSKKSEIKIDGERVSKDYITVTLKSLNEYGIDVEVKENGFVINGRQSYISPNVYAVEGDYSSAASLLCLGATCGSITVKGLKKNSEQADREIINLLKKVGAEVLVKDNSVTVAKKELKPINFDARHCPDLVPVMAATLALAKGESIIESVDRLKAKESDRLKETISLLNCFGIKVAAEGNALLIVGGIPTGCNYHSPDDHRMAMAATILASSAQGESNIINASCVSKSYPKFFEIYENLKITTAMFN